MKKNFGTLALVIFLAMQFIACGGSKQSGNFEPDPFPEPPPRKTQPEPKEEAPPKPKPEMPKPDRLVLSTVYFEFDKSALTPEAQATLAENARQLQQHPEAKIRIEGHCDERGTVEYNLALGQRRAISVRDYLNSFGISPDRITIISYGKERPVDPRHNEEAWAKNRRAEFVILNQ